MTQTQRKQTHAVVWAAGPRRQAGGREGVEMGGRREASGFLERIAWTPDKNCGDKAARTVLQRPFETLAGGRLSMTPVSAGLEGSGQVTFRGGQDAPEIHCLQ